MPGEPTLLADDDLAAELAPEGRLGSLVAALGAAPVGSPVRDATCLAIDPDLVETAVAMRSGYQVVTVSGPPVPGAGADVAGRWVDRLVAAARGGCVLALPFADADLVALSRGGLGPLAVTAQVEGRQLLTELLGTPVLDQAGWPVDGIADEPTLDRIADAGGRAVLLSADGIEQDRLPLRTGVLSLEDRSSPQFAVLTDPLLGVAAAGPRPSSLVSSTRGSVPTSSPAGGGSPLSTQDVIGALAFRARAGPDGGAPVVLAPPHQWASEGSGATALLQSIDVLLETGHLTPRPLGEVLAAGPPADAPARSVSYPLRAGGREVVSAVADAVRGTDAQIADLRSAAVADSGIGLSPDAVLAPLVRGAVRPMSAAWRGRPEGALATAAADARRIAELRSTVRVLEPPSPYALGTSDAPLLVTIGNGLPFTVRVQPEIASTSGLRVAPIEMQQVPPLGRRQVQVSAQVTRSGQFTVQAAVRSPNGEPLGPPSQLRVRSTAYGTITVWLTASAGILLVVLAVRRILRRVRVEPPVHTGPIPLDPIPPSTPPGPAPPRWPTPGRGRPAADRRPVPRPGPEPGPGAVPGRPPTDRPAGTQRPAAHSSEVAGPGRVDDATAGGRVARPAGRAEQPEPADAAEPGSAPRRRTERGDAAEADPVTEKIPAAGPGRESQPSLGRSSSLMAVASLVSRITGFLRQIALVTVLTVGVVTDSYMSPTRFR